MKKAVSIIMALILVLCLAACGTNNTAANSTNNNSGHSHSGGGYSLSSLKFPETVSYPDYESFYKNEKFDDSAYDKALNEWTTYTTEKNSLIENYTGKLDTYFKNVSAFLTGSDNPNVVCSPVNIFFALAMLAEAAKGESRDQIMDVLGVKSIDELRSIAKALWEYHYSDDDMIKVLLGSSVWMNTGRQELEFNMDTIAILAEYYYATAYSGSSSDPGFTTEFKNWLNEQTGGLLKDQIESLEGLDDPSLVMAIATTIYFKGSWEEKFNESATKDDEFTNPDGTITVPFMHRTGSMWYYEGEGYSAISLPFNLSNRMWIILPEEGTSPESLNENGVLADFPAIASGEESDGPEFKTVKLSLPKFDVNATTDLIPILQKLGITDVFLPDKADLHNITESTDPYVSKVTHSARVKIDEEGCEAAAFTVIMTKDLAFIAEEPIDFNVNRPFAFIITGDDGSPLFTGIVNSPVK